MVNYQEAYRQSLEYFNNDELAASVFLGKYALTKPDGDILEPTPAYMHQRLAKEFARIENKYPNPLSEEEIYSYLDRFKYIVPQGSPMAGIGNPYQIMSLSNCFVIAPPCDSYGGILKTDQEEAQLMKRRGGVGFDISTIRPKGLITGNAAKTTDGIGVFMERFSNTCREVAQGGRRGALMLTVSVHHPEIKTFIHIKRNLEKVTGANISIRLSDEFMNAVDNGKKVQLRWPVDSDSPEVESWEDAKELWNEIIESAHASAEPGLLFWGNVKNNSPADSYESKGFGTTSTNPCFSGDTLVAVADGRNAVPIKQLAEEGRDVPVYSVNPHTGMVEIKTGRNPRITGHNKKLLRIHLDDGSYYDVTPNHKMLLRDGEQKEARELEKGDSLSPFKKDLSRMNSKNKYYRIRCDTRAHRNNYKFEHRLIAEHFNPNKWNKLYDENKRNGWVKGGLVVHHKDYNGLNNKPENLEVMTWKEHQKYHAEHDTGGQKNGMHKGKSSQEIYEQALRFTKKLGRRFSHQEWLKFADENNFPKSFSKMHYPVLGKKPSELAKLCANELGIENIDKDPRLTKTLTEMLRQGYEAEIIENKVFTKKQCEGCEIQFLIEYNRREVSFCSHRCYLQKHNQNKELHEKRVGNTLKTYEKRAEKTKEEQAKIWSQLKFELDRRPLVKEWEEECKKLGISSRYGANFGFQNWKEVCAAGEDYNHKVVSVEELSGEHTVYNITVDDNHTLAIVSEQNDNHGNKFFNGINTLQCGEITLSNYDSCRLLLVNTFSFVENAYTENAKFNWDKFAEVTQVAQRLMDDVVDLEIECIDRILEKIYSDPEPEEVKQNEIRLWERIKQSAIDGRRTGLGVTGIGDAVAAMNVQYGNEDSINLIEEIYKHLALNSYRSSVQLAEERGPFGAYEYDLEKDNTFINRVMELDSKLASKWKKHGRRNIANTTTAPAGSVSMLTQTTSGIEPVFRTEYKRRKKINPSDQISRVDFVDDLGDKWQEYSVYHHGVRWWMEATGETDTDKSPYYGATSEDIDWVNKVKAQAAAQKWIDHSISNTTNVPEDTTVDTIKEIYMTGWKSGCKGVTVYRDKCRDGVLLTTEEERKQKKFTEMHAPKRPEKLPCDIYHIQVKGERWNVFVGLYNDKPYEIFAGRSRYIWLPRSRRKGVIKKNGTYNLHTGEGDNELVIEDLATVFDNPAESAFTRTVSLALRHGTPVQYVVEQIEKGSDKDSDMFSLSKGLMRVLKNYIEDGTKPSQKKCDNCGQDDLAYEEGCITCKACGHSKCS